MWKQFFINVIFFCDFLLLFHMYKKAFVKEKLNDFLVNLYIFFVILIKYLNLKD